MFKTILLAYDGSDHADNAIRIAAGMVKAFDSKLHVSHTPQVDTPPIVIGAFVDALQKPPSDAQIEEAGKHLTDQAQERAQEMGVNVASSHIGRGNPASEILKAADKVGADLIIMGRRGLGSIGALALGSVSQAVAHNAKCVCMTVV